MAFHFHHRSCCENPVQSTKPPDAKPAKCDHLEYISDDIASIPSREEEPVHTKNVIQEGEKEGHYTVKFDIFYMVSVLFIKGSETFSRGEVKNPIQTV